MRQLSVESPVVIIALPAVIMRWKTHATTLTGCLGTGMLRSGVGVLRYKRLLDEN